MSDTIDLTKEEDDDNSPSTEEVEGTETQNSNKKRKKREHRPTPPPPQQQQRPSRVFVVIHDKEPPDTGGGRYSTFLPSRVDTEIVGVFYDYKKATKNATNYVRSTWDIWDDDDDDDDDEEVTPLHCVDWKGEGWYRPERSDVNECDDRVRIEEQSIK
mmetsp:Transcript_5627/g.6538  ORF Transcript_5627/g.6538 Transcript_5627/m.6538 type:complete len:158 (+) Transcript_5627:81-554(+)